jgi:hypothetical protein
MRYSKQRKLIIFCTISVIAYVIFLLPLPAPFVSPFPFVDSLWRNNTLRHSMAGGASRIVIGLDMEEVTLILGETEPGWPPGVFVYSLYSGDSGYKWKCLNIFFDENGIAYKTIIANPLHL